MFFIFGCTTMNIIETDLFNNGDKVKYVRVSYNNFMQGNSLTIIDRWKYDKNDDKVTLERSDSSSNTSKGIVSNVKSAMELLP
jgi:hypothetical protein